MSKTSDTEAQHTNEIDISRRDILRGATVATAVAAGAGGLAPTSFATATPGTSLAQNPIQRAQDAARLRRQRANVNRREAPNDPQEVNDDEIRLPDFIGNFSKTLKHNARGEVGRASYLSMTTALASRDDADFEAIRVGRENDPNRERLVSPQAAYAFELSGLDGNANRIPAAPAFDGDVTAAEMGEMYAYSVTRDVPFINYGSSNRIARVVRSLNEFTRSDIFPSDGGEVTPDTFGRGGIPLFGLNAPGTLTGPFVSQFLLKEFQIGQLTVDQRYPKLERGAANQFMTTFEQVRAIQRGFNPNASENPTQFRDTRRFISRMRDLSEWVHRDFPLQSPLHALSVIFGFGTDDAFDPALPYLRANSSTQGGFASFGLADISHLTVHGPRQALTGAWYQKWLNHRRARPEVYGMRVNVQLRDGFSYLGGSDILGQEVADSRVFRMAANEIRRVNGASDTDTSNDGILPMGFPEGSPAHPAYPGGHSSFVAAGATVLKAFVNEDFVIPDPVQADANGRNLVPWTGGDVTIGGELNKLVANVTHARDAAGMHWRSDGVGNLIGEAVGIALLRDYSVTYNEEFDGLTLRKFDGQRIRISDGRVTNIPG
ncbi:MAG: phosphoesterase [Pseudomonadota bacterium]